MPDRTELPHAASGADDVVGPRPSRRPVEAVLFDFHGTLAQVEEPLTWVLAAASACGVELDRIRATSLADRLLGRQGRMIEAVKAIGPGRAALEGDPFRVDLE